MSGTVEDFRALLLAPVFSKNTKISQDTYRALSLDGSSGAELFSDKATAPKRIWAFLRLCVKFIPFEHEAYDHAVACLDAEVDADVSKARTVLKITQEQCLPVPKNSACQSLSRPKTKRSPCSSRYCRACSVPHGGLQSPHARCSWSRLFPQN